MPGEEDQQQQELSAETLELAALGRGEVVNGGDGGTTVEAKGEPAKAERPAHVPEKFWDAEKGETNVEALLKSYAELEKMRGKPEGKDDDGDAGDDGGAGEEGGAAVSGIPAELFSSAEAEWAEKGELTSETREKIIASGVPAETLDTYLAGVAALSVALTASVYEAAGGEENYKAAVEWARENWTPGQIEKFDAGIADADLMPVLVKALMADFGGANPGEGQQTRGGAGSSGDSDLYHDAEEFTRDLQAADMKNDALARRKAVQKLERSKKAGTLKHVTPRSGVSQLLR